jgi:hypothetical protein
VTKEDLLAALLDFIEKHEAVSSASRVDGEDAIGLTLTGGEEYFLELTAT